MTLPDRQAETRPARDAVLAAIVKAAADYETPANIRDLAEAYALVTGKLQTKPQ